VTRIITKNKYDSSVLQWIIQQWVQTTRYRRRSENFYENIWNNTVCLEKTRPLRSIWHNFTNS